MLQPRPSAVNRTGRRKDQKEPHEGIGRGSTGRSARRSRVPGSPGRKGPGVHPEQGAEAEKQKARQERVAVVRPQEADEQRGADRQQRQQEAEGDARGQRMGPGRRPAGNGSRISRSPFPSLRRTMIAPPLSLGRVLIVSPTRLSPVTGIREPSARSRATTASPTFRPMRAAVVGRPSRSSAGTAMTTIRPSRRSTRPKLAASGTKLMDWTKPAPRYRSTDALRRSRMSRRLVMQALLGVDGGAAPVVPDSTAEMLPSLARPPVP